MMDKHVNFYFHSLLSIIIYVFDILFNLPESRKLRKILPGFSTSHSVASPARVRARVGQHSHESGPNGPATWAGPYGPSK